MMLRRTLLVLVVAGMAMTPAVANADLEDELAEITKRIDEIEKEAAAAGNERGALVAELVETRDELAVLGAELAAAESVLTDARASRSAKRDEVAELDRQINIAVLRLEETDRTMSEARIEAETLTRDRYMSRGSAVTAGLIVSATSLSDLESTLAYLDRIASVSEEVLDRYDALAAYQQSQRQEVRRQEARATEELEALRVIERELAAARAEVRTRTEAVADVVARQEAALRALDVELSSFEKELDQLEREQDRIEDLINGESGGGGSSPGSLVRPVPGRITSPFGPRTHPILGTVRMHTGIDMSAPYGQPIKAAAGGRVILAGSYGGYGNTVMIDHGGGMVTLYAHQSRIRVSYGDTVEAAQVIGESGSSGLATGPHLHFEVRIGGRPVDPVDYL